MRDLIWRVIRWFAFRLDAETAHLGTIALIRLAIRLGGFPLRLLSGVPKRAARLSTPRYRTLGMEFCTRVGLAAGFDKNCELLEGLPAFGFGFAEIGTVTPRPQPGNDRPRLFRAPAEGAIFNRMGFNSLGAEVVSRRLREVRPRLPEEFRVGVNIGKNKDTPNEQASSDYQQAARAFQGLADYLVINVSSPNTPGLRALQSAEALRPIVEAVTKEIGSWERRPPLLLKLAPELSDEELSNLVPKLESWGVDGWVLTNTLAGNWNRGVSNSLPGGWSGKPLTERSRHVLRAVRSISQLPIISVGGIDSVEEAEERIRLGADLIQVYTGWVFNGPAFVAKIAEKLR